MAYINCDKLCLCEFHNKVSAKDKVQDINLNQLELGASDTYKKDEKQE